MEPEGGESSRYVLPDLNVEWKPTAADDDVEAPANQEVPDDSVNNETTGNDELPDSVNGGVASGGSGGPGPSTGGGAGSSGGGEAGPSTSVPDTNLPAINPPVLCPPTIIEVEPNMDICVRLRHLGQLLHDKAFIVLSGHGILRAIVLSIAGIRRRIEGPLPIIRLQGAVHRENFQVALTAGVGNEICGGKLISATVHQTATRLHLSSFPGYVMESTFPGYVMEAADDVDNDDEDSEE